MKELHSVPDEKNSFALQLPPDFLDVILRRDLGYIDIEIDNSSYTAVLENIKGALVICCEEMPATYYGCHLWNKGVFPYIIKKDLRYITLTDGERRSLTVRITGHETHVDERCVITTEGEPVPDEKGDACIWNVRFHFEPCAPDGSPLKEGEDGLVREPNFYLLRWNPAISSLTLALYEEHIERHWKDGVFNWSVYEWEDAHDGDVYFMLRTGDDLAGIVYSGTFEGDPYEGDDWAGTARPRHYCNYSIASPPAEASGEPLVSLSFLERHLPEINWRKGHSGEQISKEQAYRLLELLKQGKH